MFGDVTFAQAPFASQGGNTFAVAISETGSGVDAINAIFTAGGLMLESASGIDSVSVRSNFVATNAETASGVDSINTLNNIFNVAIPEAASGVDAFWDPNTKYVQLHSGLFKPNYANNQTYVQGSNYSVGSGNLQIESMVVAGESGTLNRVTGSLSGTWKWMGPNSTMGPGNTVTLLIALGCRVS
jgi:hypothetical protein